MNKTTDTNCSLCNKRIPAETEFHDINICAVHYNVCELCHKKLYYHFRDIIINKIKHP